MNFIKHHARKLIGATLIAAGLIAMASCGGGGGGGSGGSAAAGAAGAADMQITPPLPRSLAEAEVMQLPAGGEVTGELSASVEDMRNVYGFSLEQGERLATMVTSQDGEVNVVFRNQIGEEIPASPVHGNVGLSITAPYSGNYYLVISAPNPPAASGATAHGGVTTRAALIRRLRYVARFVKVSVRVIRTTDRDMLARALFSALRKEVEEITVEEIKEEIKELLTGGVEGLIDRSRPDLAAHSAETIFPFGLRPTSVLPGAPFMLKVRVENVGGSPSPSASLRYRRSTDATITETDDLVGEPVTVRSLLGFIAGLDLGSGLPSQRAIDFTVDINAPMQPGVYYYGGCVQTLLLFIEKMVPATDGAQLLPSRTMNNCSEGVALTVEASLDLTVAASVSDSTLTPGQSFTLRATVRNAGSGDSAAATLRYYRSSDSTITTSDTSVGSDAVSALAAGATSAESIGLTAPNTAGTYYYGACVTTVASESNAANNCSSGVSVRVRGQVVSGRQVYGVAIRSTRPASLDASRRLCESRAADSCSGFTDFGLAERRDFISMRISDGFCEFAPPDEPDCDLNDAPNHRCFAIIFPVTCLAGGLGGWGSTPAAARSDAINSCRDPDLRDLYPTCTIETTVCAPDGQYGSIHFGCLPR